MRRAYEDEDDIEEILPLALALGVFDFSNLEVPLPSRFRSVCGIWKRSDWFAIGGGDLLSGESAIRTGESASEVGVILYSQNMFFCVPALARGVDRSGIVANLRTEAKCGLSASGIFRAHKL